MFVSFTDWEFDGNVDNAMEAARGFWPEMKKHGAVNCANDSQDTSITLLL